MKCKDFRIWQRLCERICKLLCRLYVGGVDNAGCLCIFGCMIPNVDVLRFLVYFGIPNEANARLIIKEKRRRLHGWIANFGEEVAKPYDLSHHCPGCNVLYFGGAGSGNALFVRVSHDRSAIKEYNIATRGFLITEISNKVCIVVCNGLMQS